MSLNETLAYIGVMVGVLLAFILPWVKHNADLVAEGGSPEPFAMKYLWAFVINLFVVLFTIGALIIAMPLPDGGTGAFAAFWTALIYGIVSAYAVKLPFDWLQSKGKGAAEVIPPNG